MGPSSRLARPLHQRHRSQPGDQRAVRDGGSLLVSGSLPSGGLTIWRARVMNHMHEELRIEAPVEHVWAFYCDTSYWPDWMPRGTCSDFSGPVEICGAS
jgi:hypothetical protein